MKDLSTEAINLTNDNILVEILTAAEDTEDGYVIASIHKTPNSLKEYYSYKSVIMIGKYSGCEIVIAGKTYRIIKQDDVFARIA